MRNTSSIHEGETLTILRPSLAKNVSYLQPVLFLLLKELSHKMYLAFYYMHGHWSVLSLTGRRGQCLTFLAASMIL
jgi:hypothetical protein